MWALKPGKPDLTAYEIRGDLMARPNKYQLHVEPYLDKIEQMALIMTEEQIAESLGVSYSTFRRYKGENQQLQAALKRGRKDLVLELKSALIKKAKGYEVLETNTVREAGLDGELTVTKYEEKVKHFGPDVAAINLLLKNYDRDNWANDPQMMEIRKKELELREKQIEENNW